MAKQKANYARQKARAEDSSLTGAERRAASEEMRKLRQRFGNEVTKGGGEKLMRRSEPQRNAHPLVTRLRKHRSRLASCGV